MAIKNSTNSVRVIWFILFFQLLNFLPAKNLHAQESPFPNEGMEKFVITNESLLKAYGLLQEDRPDEIDSLYSLSSNTLAKDLKDSVQYVFSVLAHAHWYTNMGDLRSAAEKVRLAKAFTTAHGVTNNITRAYTLNLEATIFNLSQQTEKMVSVLDSALTTYKKGPYQHEDLYLQIVRNKHFIYKQVPGKVDTLIKYLDIAEEVFRKHTSRIRFKPQPYQWDKLYIDYGETYTQLGDYNKAITYYLEAIKGIEEKGRQNDLDYLNARLRLVISYYLRDELSIGLELCKALIADIEQIYPKGDVLRMEYYNMLALFYSKLGQDEEALALFERCQLLLKEDYSETIYYCNALLNVGEGHLNLADYKKSRYYFEQALERAKSLFGQNHPSNAAFYSYLSRHYEVTGNSLLALAYTDSALQNYIPSHNGGPLVVPDLKKENLAAEILNTLHSLTDHLHWVYEQEKGGAEYLLALVDYSNTIQDILAEKRQSFEEYESILFNSSEYKSITENTLSALYSLYKKNPNDTLPSEALNFISLSKSMLLNAEQGEYRLINDPETPQLLRENFVESKQQIETLNREINKIMSASLSNDSIKVLNSEKMKWQNKLSQTKESLKSKAGFIGTPDSIGKIDIAFIRANFVKTKEQAFIEFFEGEQAIYAVGISKDKVTLKYTLKDTTLNNHLTAFLKIFEEFDSKEIASIEDYIKHASYLYAHLLEPIFSDLDQNIDQTMIVADGIMTQLPFDLLIKNNSKEQDFRQLPYLLKDMDVHYALTSRTKAKTEKRAAELGVVGFAYSGEGISDTRAELGGIPGAFEEIAYLKGRYKGDYFVGNAGSKKRFLEEAGKYDVVHLAVHGNADLNDRFNSNLIFNGDNNYTLNSSDLYGMLFNSRMVVLSACESGLGEIKQGEGSYSVARGFASAGVPSIITTLWKVNDMTSMRIVTDFYNNLDKEMTKSEAMRQAKLHFLSNSNNLNGHPYYWGSFMVMGDNSAIHIEKEDNRGYYLLLISVLGIALMLYARRRVRKTKNPSSK